MRINRKKNLDKISKGYRLKKSTHKLIDKMQEIMQCSQDKVITKACKKLYHEIKDTKGEI